MFSGLSFQVLFFVKFNYKTMGISISSKIKAFHPGVSMWKKLKVREMMAFSLGSYDKVEAKTLNSTPLEFSHQCPALWISTTRWQKVAWLPAEPQE